MASQEIHNLLNELNDPTKMASLKAEIVGKFMDHIEAIEDSTALICQAMSSGISYNDIGAAIAFAMDRTGPAWHEWSDVENLMIELMPDEPEEGI